MLWVDIDPSETAGAILGASERESEPRTRSDHIRTQPDRPQTRPDLDQGQTIRSTGADLTRPRPEPGPDPEQHGPEQNDHGSSPGRVRDRPPDRPIHPVGSRSLHRSGPSSGPGSAKTGSKIPRSAPFLRSKSNRSASFFIGVTAGFAYFPPHTMQILHTIPTPFCHTTKCHPAPEMTREQPTPVYIYYII